MKNNKILICCLALFITSCATNAYNVPFVDATETVLLTSGMSRSEVLSDMGQPLYVEYGDESTGEIFWVYEVRGKNVKSDIIPTGEIIPNKTHSTTRPTSPIHRLRLEFKNDKLFRWMPIPSLIVNGEKNNQEDNNNNTTNIDQTPKDTLYVIVVNEPGAHNTSDPTVKTKSAPVKKKKNFKFFFQPQVSLTKSSASLDFEVEWNDNNDNGYDDEDDYFSYEHNDYYKCSYCYDLSYMSLSAFFGFERNNFRFGPEFGLNSNGGMFMLKFERLKMSNANLNFAFALGGNMYMIENGSQGAYSISDISSNNNYDKYDDCYMNDSNWSDCIHSIDDINNLDDYRIRDMDLESASFLHFSLGKDFPFQGKSISPKYTLGIGPQTTHTLSVGYNLR